MSATSQPIAPELFLQAIRDLELEQLHTETARLQLSLYHLRRSQVVLEEFRDDPVCRSAIEDNEVVIRNQVDRIDFIRLEVERRGLSMEHGAGAKEKLVNGNIGLGLEESLGREVTMGGIGEDDGNETRTARITVNESVATDTAVRESGAGEHRGESAEGPEEGEGVYL